MRHLANGPAAIAIGSVQLRRREPFYRGAQFGRSLRDSVDRLLPRCGSHFQRHDKLSDRVAWILHWLVSSHKSDGSNAGMLVLDARPRESVTYIRMPPPPTKSHSKMDG